MMQSAPFVHPQLAVAAIAVAALPIIIHLIHRRRYHRMSWAAMGFLKAATRRSARRILLEHWTLLIVRMCVVLLLGLAVARPFFPSSALASLGRPRTHRIVLLDNSCSMGARLQRIAPGGHAVAADSPTRFDEAMRVTEELISSFPRGDAMSLVTLSHPAQPLIHDAAYERRRVRDRLAGVELTQRSTDLAGGLEAALAILAESDVAPRNRVVYIVSDLLASGWDQDAGGGESGVALDLARRVADEADMVFCRVGSGASDNIAVTVLRSDLPVTGRGMPARLTVEVANYSDQPVRGAVLTVSLDDRIVREVSLDTLGPFATREIGVSVPMDDPGMRIVKVMIDHPRSLGGDTLSVDNDRWLVIDVRESIPVLLVDGRPGASALAGQTGYLSTALSPEAGREGANWLRSTTSIIVPRVVSASTFPSEPLSEYAVVVLCNVPRLETRDWDRLRTYLGDGGGLLVFAGDMLDTENYNEHGYAAGEGVLPCSMSTPVTSGVVQADDPFVHFASDRLAHPVLADFADQTDSSLFLARVHRYMTVTSADARVAVPLRYTDGRPALLSKMFATGESGGGRVILCTTTADTAWTNLPAKGDYVSLMVNLVTFLGGSHGPRRTLSVGDWISERLTARESAAGGGSIRFRTPDGGVRNVQPALTTTGSTPSFSLRLGPLERPGTYVASVAGRSTAYAVNVDARESDLRGMSEDALRAALDRDVTYVDVTEMRRDSAAGRVGSAIRPFTAATEVAGGLLAAVLALLLVECWLAARFGRSR